MKKVVNILVLGFIILQQGCKKEPPKNPENLFFELGEAINYLYSKPGSYWIYKNTKTNELDTQICTAFLIDTLIKIGTENYSKHITIKYERMRRYIQSSFNKWVYFDETFGYSPDATPIRPKKAVIDRLVGSEGIIVPFFHPFILNDRSGTGSSNTYYKGMDITLTLHNKTYYDVVRFDIDMDEIGEKDCPNIPVTSYYWAKDVGLIKKTIKNCNYSWELIDYNIIK